MDHKKYCFSLHEIGCVRRDHAEFSSQTNFMQRKAVLFVANLDNNDSLITEFYCIWFPCRCLELQGNVLYDRFLLVSSLSSSRFLSL